MASCLSPETPKESSLTLRMAMQRGYLGAMQGPFGGPDLPATVPASPSWVRASPWLRGPAQGPLLTPGQVPATLGSACGPRMVQAWAWSRPRCGWRCEASRPCRLGSSPSRDSTTSYPGASGLKRNLVLPVFCRLCFLCLRIQRER